MVDDLRWGHAARTQGVSSIYLLKKCFTQLEVLKTKQEDECAQCGQHIVNMVLKHERRTGWAPDGSIMV
jgi:rRNA maturation endonuclease Nob1